MVVVFTVFTATRFGITLRRPRDHGLFRYRDGTMQQFAVAQGLPFNSLYQILQDRRGTMWLTSPNLIASVAENEIDGPYPSRDRPSSTMWNG